MNKENFKQLAMDMKPLISAMIEILKTHGVEKLVSVTCDSNGYCMLSTTECDWEMYRLDEKGTAKVGARLGADSGEEV